AGRSCVRAGDGLASAAGADRGGRMTDEPVIGLEVPAQPATRAKLFCASSTAFGAPPNANTCPVCMAFPGVLPVLNRQAGELAIRAGLSTGCWIAQQSSWARKNSLSPDLPL